MRVRAWMRRVAPAPAPPAAARGRTAITVVFCGDGGASGALPRRGAVLRGSVTRPAAPWLADRARRGGALWGRGAKGQARQVVPPARGSPHKAAAAHRGAAISTSSSSSSSPLHARSSRASPAARSPQRAPAAKRDRRPATHIRDPYPSDRARRAAAALLPLGFRPRTRVPPHAGARTAARHAVGAEAAPAALGLRGCPGRAPRACPAAAPGRPAPRREGVRERARALVHRRQVGAGSCELAGAGGASSLAQGGCLAACVDSGLCVRRRRPRLPAPPPRRYGCKTELTGLMLEWVKDIGSQAGLGASNTRLSTGSVGTPESRLEVGAPARLQREACATCPAPCVRAHRRRHRLRCRRWRSALAAWQTGRRSCRGYPAGSTWRGARWAARPMPRGPARPHRAQQLQLPPARPPWPRLPRCLVSCG
jgi:hypothetical protein